MTLYLIALVGMALLVGRDALLDRTPRRPWVWRRPHLEWWATKRTRKELARNSIPVSGA